MNKQELFDRDFKICSEYVSGPSPSSMRQRGDHERAKTNLFAEAFAAAGY